MEPWITKHLSKLVENLAPCDACPWANTHKVGNLPGRQAVVEVLDSLVETLFPGCRGKSPLAHESYTQILQRSLASTAHQLCDQIERALAYQCALNKCDNCNDCHDQASAIVAALFESLPEIRLTLRGDIQAAYEGDPAAASTMEVVLSYPGVYAVSVHRLAHALYTAKVPLLPRIWSEHAHSLTGIDIHPGATIGPGFFIDHGTGVVIGETCVIGSHVKLYQGVTLGALSFANDEDGHPIKGIKRHPDVEDHVVIYAGATILGGDTVIGHNSVIGGNVWLLHSVPPYSKVYNQQPPPLIKSNGRQ
ncbi:MAG: serine acetyltransferase [Lentisphaerae bacterium]|nr:serine acetyltransferase [Lentisphaerota bacterium]